MKNMKLNKRLFCYFSSIFLLLMTVIVLFQYQREKKYRVGQLEAQLETCNRLIHNFAVDTDLHESGGYAGLCRLFPDTALRITLVALDGRVLFDSTADTIQWENHLTRPEIQEARKKGSGRSIRMSGSVNRSFYYLAHAFPDMYVRTALPYTLTLRNTLGANMGFLYLMAALFVVVIIVVYIIAARFTSSLQNQEIQMRRQLTQNISHELRTPVAGISGYLESILSNPGLPSEKQHFFIERSYQQAQRLTALIQDISTLNQLTENQDLYEKADCDLSRIIAAVLQDVQPQKEAHHAEIVVDIPDRMPIRGNRNLLYSVFRNMIDNALAYAGDGCTTTVKLLCDDHKFYYFSIADNGTGVPEEHLSRLFDRFYRVDKGRSRKSGGTGLGLSIVKNAVLFHKGIITVANRTSGGLEFTFSLRKR